MCPWLETAMGSRSALMRQPPKLRVNSEAGTVSGVAMDPHFYALIHATYVKNAQDALSPPCRMSLHFAPVEAPKNRRCRATPPMPLRPPWAEVGAACPLLEQGM